MTNLIIDEDESILNECRICYDNVENPRKYCLCQGTTMNIHPMCLIKSMNENNVNYIDSRHLEKKCDICNYNIKMIKTKTWMSIILNGLFCLLFLILFVIFSYLDFEYKFEKNLVLGIMYLLGFTSVLFCYFLVVKYLIYKLKIHEYKISILEYNE